MKDQFYIVLPSNNSMRYHPNNITTRFVTQLPQQIRLEGLWSVALSEIQIPMTFQHIPQDEDERFVCVKNIAISPLETNRTRSDDSTTKVGFIRPGVYKHLESLIEEINSLNCVKDYLHFHIEHGGYVSIRRICLATECLEFNHTVQLSEKVRRILGFDSIKYQTIIVDKDGNPTIADYPANLANGLPTTLMLYADICEPYVIGDVQAKLLRVVSLNTDKYKYGGVKIKNFSPPMYIPLLINSFQTIEIDIRDQQGRPIPFDYGTLTVTLHFNRTV
jgi:hypothetical protein